MQHIIYLHGFNSSSKAQKAQLLAAYCRDKADILFSSPDLSYYPAIAIRTVEALLKESQVQHKQQSLVFIGSSLGGYYAQYFANLYTAAKIVLINPVVYSLGLERSMSLEQAYLYGSHQNTILGETLKLSKNNTADYLQQFVPYAIKDMVNPERLLLLLQTDDELLNYQLALDKFPGAQKIIRTGGGHLFTDFEQVLPDIIKFILTNR